MLLTGCFVSAIALFSCNTIDVFEKFESFPKNEWHVSKQPSFAFEVKDTTAPYHIYFVIRHTDAYKYNNIWLNVKVHSKTDTIVNQKLDIGLATDATGWEGIAMNDIWEIRKKITAAPFKFTKKDTYQYSLTQLMRDNPLLNVLSAGIRIEKVSF